MNFSKILCGAAAAMTICASSARADEEALKMIEEAMPVMFYTCGGIIEKADGDNQFVLDVVKKIVAVSIYNHGINVDALAKTDEDKAALRERFLDELKESCAVDEDALLAGAIDTAVRIVGKP